MKSESEKALRRRLKLLAKAWRVEAKLYRNNAAIGSLSGREEAYCRARYRKLEACAVALESQLK